MIDVFNVFIEFFIVCLNSINFLRNVIAIRRWWCEKTKKIEQYIIKKTSILMFMSILIFILLLKWFEFYNCIILNEKFNIKYDY